MKKVSHFLVEKRKIVLAVFIVLALVCTLLMLRVEINSDMTKYLPDSSPMKTGTYIIADEFPAASSFNLMFEGLSEAEKPAVEEFLSNIEHVDTVLYEEEASNKGGYTLYVLNLSAAANTDEVDAVVAAIDGEYSGYEYTMSGDALGNSAIGMLPKIAGIAFAILLVILFIMCNSWIEPLLFLITIAVAILLNMGTNIIFGSVSDITAAIAAILQLVLSMDYSIMLLDRYRQERAVCEDKGEAMKNALVNAFVSISSSSVTTIVGMLALVFMSFTIGRDLGFVLAKGVLLSLVCIFTVLPALILMCDRLIQKTAKKSLHIKMDKIGAFSYRARRVIPIAFVLLFAGSFYLKGNVGISYSTSEYYEINQTFQLSNPIIVVYENSEEEQVGALLAAWEGLDNMNSVNAYATTLGREMTCSELAEAAGMDEALVAQIYYYYFRDEAPEQTMTLGEFIEFVQTDVAQNEMFGPLLPDDILTQLEAFNSPEAQPRLSAGEFALYSGMDADVADQIFGYYFMMHGQTEDGKIPLDALLQFLLTEVAPNEQFAPYFSEDTLAQLQSLAGVGGEGNVMEREMTAAELAEMLQTEPEMIEQLFYYHAISRGDMPQGEIALYDFMQFILGDVAQNELFQPYFTEDSLLQLEQAQSGMDEGVRQLRGENYSRVILDTSLAEESEETFAFIQGLEDDLGAALGGEYYIVGNSAMAYEMSESFPSEMNMITILTAVAIFLVVAVAFRSVSVPLILVCIIQCAIFITMGTIYIQGNSIYYLPLLIVQCLLMGATVDYGILLTSHYREARKTLERKNAVINALNNSIHTILTSALILISITAILGFIMAGSDPAVSEILLIVARGGLASSILVVFVLPGILVAFDRFVCGKKRAE